MPRLAARMLDAGPVVVLAAIAGAGSFAHIHDTAAQHGQGGPMAWAIAVCVDLTCVMAARERQHDKKTGRHRRGWVSWPTLVLAGGVLLSLAANLAQADPSIWGRIVAATPAGAFLVAVSMLERRAGGARATVATTEPADTSATSDAPAVSSDAAPVAEPAPEPGERRLPDDLVAFAQRVATEHHNRRGQPITTDALRTRMGVSAPLAAELHHRVTADA